MICIAHILANIAGNRNVEPALGGILERASRIMHDGAYVLQNMDFSVFVLILNFGNGILLSIQAGIAGQRHVF